jgi:Flp pilus assembly protein TadG
VFPHLSRFGTLCRKSRKYCVFQFGTGRKTLKLAGFTKMQPSLLSHSLSFSSNLPETTGRLHEIGRKAMKTASKRDDRKCRFWSDRRGNFAIMTALILPAAIFTVGVSVDLISALDLKSDLQSSADAAALAASSAMISTTKTYTKAQAEAEAKQLIVTQLSQSLAASGSSSLSDQLADNTEVTVSKVPSPKATIYNAVVTTSFNMPLTPMTRLFAGDTMTVKVNSSSQSSRSNTVGLSMYLALDRSGSMSFLTDETDPDSASCDNYTSTSWPNKDTGVGGCRMRKVKALKKAADSLFKAFDKMDPSKNLVRVGAVAYTHETYPPQAITWGTSAASAYVTAIPDKPEGGTDSSGAMQVTYDALKSSNTTEATAQSSVGNTSFKRFILLMTDGEMTGYSNAWNATLDQATRDICTRAKNDGITIYTVAFMAPARGKSLLSFCATDASSYYEATNMTSLVSAFEAIAAKATKSTSLLTQ